MMDKEELVLSLIRDVDRTNVQIGVLLDQLRTEWDDPERLNKLRVKAGMGRRRFYALLLVGSIVNGGLVSEETAEQIGWTKLAMIAKHLVAGSDNDAWIKAALENNAATLSKMLDGDDEERNAVVFKLTKTEENVLRRALERHGALKHGLGHRGKETALMAILVRSMQADVQMKEQA